MYTCCEIEGCEGEAKQEVNGISLCGRCAHRFVSVGVGAVQFGGRWHGVRGSHYSTEQMAQFDGLQYAIGFRARTHEKE
jgi:hypothetical protein